MIAAAQAHDALGVTTDDYVDVFGALRRIGVEVVGRELGGLLGLYVDRADGGPACLVNTGLEEAGMRHTAAHELGHHRLGHGTSIDHQEYAPGRWGEGWPQHEREAEAFASWFLMPRPAARTALARCGRSRPESPLDAYRMARWLGTPYATTVRHLVRLKMIDRSTEARWLRRSPGSIKEELANGLPLGPRAHVHVLTPVAHSAVLQAAAGDCLLLDVPRSSYDGLPAGLTFVPPSSAGQISILDSSTSPGSDQAVWVTEDLATGVAVSVTVDGIPDAFRVALRRTPGRAGSDRFWE